MTADEQYQQNLAFLATRPNMAGMLEQLPHAPMTNIQLMPGAKGHLFGQVFDPLTQQWWALCSPDDPVGEAERDCDQLYTRDAKVFTLLGMGLGYFATAFAKRLQPWQRLVVWDTDPTLFKAMLHAVDISPLFSDKHTDVHIGNDVLGQVEGWWLRLEATEKLHIVLPFRASYTGGPNKLQYDGIMEKTVEMIRFHHVGLSTWRMFGGCIGDNDLENLPDYFLNPGINTLKDLWKDRPAVCVAAGPSLHKNVRQLLRSRVRDRLAVISVGTVYALLHGLGLDPDIIATIDFQELNFTDQFARVPLDPRCPLVYLHSTYPQTVRRWPGPRFVATNASDTTSWISQYSEPKGSAAEVQTVAHLCLKVALMLGANPIILMGQDLSMPIDTHHATGARAQDASPGESSPEAFMVVPDFQGKPVHTRHSFLSMQTVFGRLMAENPDRTFYNCSEAGLKLEGAIHVPLAEALATCAAAPAGRNTLRVKLYEQFVDYKPQMKDTFYTEWDQLGVAMEELVEWATLLPKMAAATEAITIETITADQWAAAAASDCDTNQQVYESIVTHHWHQLLETERVIQERQVALSLFAIRRFDFLELMSAIPPTEEEVHTELLRAVFNAKRLLVVAQMIREEAPVLQRLFRRVSARLEGLIDPPMETGPQMVQRFFARQRYESGLELLRQAGKHQEEWSQAATRHWQHLYMHYLWHTQQYDAASAIMLQWGFAPEKRAKAEAYLTQWHADVREAMEAYFQPTMPKMAVEDLEPWVYY